MLFVYDHDYINLKAGVAMKNKWVSVCLVSVLMGIISVSAYAGKADETNYVKVVLPQSPNGAKPTYTPAYIYVQQTSGGPLTQLQNSGYVPFAGAPNYLGDANTVFNMNSAYTYYVIHQDTQTIDGDTSWRYCSFQLGMNAGQAVITNNTCAAVLSQPETGSNEYDVNLGAGLWNETTQVISGSSMTEV